MPDSVYTSLENGDQSYVPLSTNQPSPKLGQAVLFKGRLALHARSCPSCVCLATAFQRLLGMAARGRLNLT